MDSTLKHLRIAVVTAEGFNEASVDVPIRIFRDRGAHIDVLSPRPEIHSSSSSGLSAGLPVTLMASRSIDNASIREYDVVLIADGREAAQGLQRDPFAQSFVAEAVKQSKPLVALGYGVEILLGLHAMRGRKASCPPTLAAKLSAQGAECVDEDWCIDGSIFTAREFNAAIEHELLHFISRQPPNIINISESA